MANVGAASKTVERLVHEALSPAQWRPLAALDAAVRMVDALVSCGGLRRGRQAEGALLALLERARNAADATTYIPDPYWSVRPAPESPEGDAQVLLRGAVAIQVDGPRATEPSMSEAEETASSEAGLTPELAAALAEPPSRPAHTLWQMLRQDGLLSPTLLTFALALGAGGVLVEALLFRGLIDLSRELSLSGQRLGAMGLILALIMLLLVLDLAAASGVLRGGRRLEVRLRTAFLAKLPRLEDRYFHSRPLSDMAERSHSVHRIRQLLSLGGQGLQLTFELVLTTAAMVWLAPASAPFAMLAAMLAIGIPLAAQPALAERDLRVRTHNGALSRFDLDALRGLVAIRTHGADRAVEHAHRHLLGEWVRASLGVHRVVMTVEGLQFLTGFGLAVALLTHQVLRGDGHAMVLLLVYWALNLPMIGQDLALLARQYPTQRNVTLRLLEPLGALEDDDGYAADVDALEAGAQPPASRQGVAITLEHVQVRLAGHLVLEKIDLNIPAGQHVAIVGASGAGKSSLVGTLLGWYRPTEGHVLIDGRVLDGQGLEQLRRQTAWVDPAVQLWNRSLLDNLHYGMAQTPLRPLPEVIEQAALRQVLEKLPDGLQSALGESGSRLSGGEGQRVRFGRALLRPETRLVILDEAFRGLDRERRRDLLRRARHLWADATLLCITHDVTLLVNSPRPNIHALGASFIPGTCRILATFDCRLQGRFLERF
jgi:ABC-type bacteriocin/lantibiotic exporter with double-glycine peptidase domain